MQWLGAIRQQAITWANVDPDLCHHTVSLCHIVLNVIQLKNVICYENQNKINYNN